MAQEISKLIPFVGGVSLGSIAAMGTYIIGKSAETYFFDGLVNKPEDFKSEFFNIFGKMFDRHN